MNRSEMAYSYAFFTLSDQLHRSPTATEILNFFNVNGYQLAVEASRSFFNSDVYCIKHSCPRKNCDCEYTAQDHIEQEVAE